MVIVVLSLVAMIGLIVLTVDVGQLLFKRRAMVNGSDAAALAAAQVCITDRSVSSANIAADGLAISNVNELTAGNGQIVDESNCENETAPTGHVTVEYSVPQDLFFAGVLGFDGPGTVRTAATAAWAPASAAGAILPIILYSSGLQGNCDLDIDNLTQLPTLPPGGPECHFWFDKDVLEGASWGFLNLNTWPEAGNTSPYPNCSNAGGADDIGAWIGGTWTGGPLQSNYPDGETYVCSSSGHVSSNWGSGDIGDNLTGRIGDIVVFPVNDPETDIEGNNGVVQYNIIGFAPLELVDVLGGTEAGGVSPIECRRPNHWQPNPGDTLDLETISGGSCPGGIEVSGTQDLTLGGIAWDDPLALYSYDQTNQIITWNGPPATNSLEIRFTWWSEGECGVPPPGQSASNAVCIKTLWQGVQLGGIYPESNSLDLGLRGVRLCDLDISGSCPEE